MSHGIRITISDVRLSSNVDASSGACLASASAANCRFYLSISSSSSQLITQTFYDIGGTSFGPPFATRGVSFHILNRAHELSEPIYLINEMTDYCLPVLNLKPVFSTHDVSNSRVDYKLEEFCQWIQHLHSHDKAYHICRSPYPCG